MTGHGQDDVMLCHLNLNLNIFSVLYLKIQKDKNFTFLVVMFTLMDRHQNCFQRRGDDSQKAVSEGGACFPRGRGGDGGGGGGGGAVNGDLRDPEGEGGTSIGPPLDLAAAVRPALGTRVDVAAVQVGVPAGAEPPAPCRAQSGARVSLPAHLGSSSPTLL